MEFIKAVFAMYHTDEEVTAALKNLETSGVSTKGVLIVHADHLSAEDDRDELHTDVQQGALIGAAVGAACGLVMALFVDKLPLMLPVTASFTAFTVFCTIFGLLLGAGSGALIGIGTPEPLSRRYAHYLSEGDVLLAIAAPDPGRRNAICEVLTQSGGFETAVLPRAETLRRLSRHYVNYSFFGWPQTPSKFAESSVLKMLRHELG